MIFDVDSGHPKHLVFYVAYTSAILAIAVLHILNVLPFCLHVAGIPSNFPVKSEVLNPGNVNSFPSATKLLFCFAVWLPYVTVVV